MTLKKVGVSKFTGSLTEFRAKGDYMNKAKQKDPEHFKWTYDQFIQREIPEPYDYVCPGRPSELYAPDKSTLFLVLFAGWDETTGYSTFYGIEAPRTCLMRQALERGEISWEDFWTREGEVYRLIVPFNPGPLFIDVIPAAQMNQRAYQALRGHGSNSPYDIKEERLRRYWEVLPSAWQDQKSEAERSYTAYLSRCGHLLTKKNAA